MKKFVLAAALAVSCLTLSATGAFAEEASGEKFLDDIQGSYVELFPEFEKEEYRSLWTDNAKEYLGVDDAGAEAAIDGLLSTYEGDLYGQIAAETWGDMSGGMEFDCYFLGGIDTLTIEGNTISGADEEGNEVFSHTYHYVEEMPYAEYEGLYFHLFESDDEDAGMFRYFSFCDDTPGETYHLEFRYGPTLEGLDTYFSGNYGFWLAAAIPADYDEELITNCINLFAQENLGGDE